MKEEALKLAEFLDTLHETNESDYGSADIIRKLVAELNRKEQVLHSIANEGIELSNDKLRWQVDDHIRWAKEALK